MCPPANQTDSPWLLLGADTDTQDTQRDTGGCCGLAAEEQVFSRMHGLAVCTASKGCPYRLDGRRRHDSTLLILPIDIREGFAANFSIFPKQHCYLVNYC